MKVNMKEIKNKLLRGTMISAAEKVENMLSTQQITMETPLKTVTQFGLRIDITLNKPSEKSPMIYTFHYMLNTIKFKEWLESNKDLCHDYMAITSYGIKVIAIGADKWDKTSFSFDEDGNEIFLRLLDTETVFHVHRDLFNKVEWQVFMEDPLAAHTER